MTRRCLLTALSILIVAEWMAAPPRAADADAVTGAAGPVAFMNQLWNRAIEVLSKDISPVVRQTRFRELFQADFDGPGIARFVLGRYWRSASDDERREFLELFENYVVLVYSTRLADFSGEVLKVRGSRSDPDGIIVSTDIISPGGAAPIKVEWRLVKADGAFKINDVTIEGISMMVTQRSEFASVIQRHGGQVEGLLTLMREKMKTASVTQ
jgi:phospholipid transport system substrate-binding protein